MDNVIKIGDFIFSQKHKSYRRFQKDECSHLHLILSDDGYHVRCKDCQLQLSAYWALQRLLDEHRRAIENLKIKKDEFEKLKSKDLSLIAAKKIEKVWRSRNYIPCCPHCGKGILLTDGFGNSTMNKAIELRRRGAVHKPIG